MQSTPRNDKISKKTRFENEHANWFYRSWELQPSWVGGHTCGLYCRYAQIIQADHIVIKIGSLATYRKSFRLKHNKTIKHVSLLRSVFRCHFIAKNTLSFTVLVAGISAKNRSICISQELWLIPNIPLYYNVSVSGLGLFKSEIDKICHREISDEQNQTSLFSFNSKSRALF